MTCFWDGINASINNRFQHPIEVCVYLKKNNSKTISIECNGQYLTPSQLEENYVSIRDYNQNNIQQGYLCSTLDPFLCLLAELFCLRVEHNYNGNLIIYQHSNYCNTVRFQSDTGHFWKI